MNISEIYKKYPVHRGLQEHMIRVGAVAKQICDNYEEEIDTESVVSACLLHDMGNLIKSSPADFPELFEPEGVKYWDKARLEMVDKYSNDVHQASESIVNEIGLDVNSKKVFMAIGSYPTERIFNDGTAAERIANYSDMRVGLNNVVSLDERMDDLRNRYAYRGLVVIEKRSNLLHEIEKIIFEKTKIKPEDINDESTREIQKELWSWNL